MDSTQRTRPKGGGSPVGLVVFIILTVVFAGLSYWGFAKYTEAQQEVITATAEQERAERDRAAARSELANFQDVAGAETPDALADVISTTLGKSRELGFGSEAQDTATDALQVALRAMEGQRDAIEKLSSDMADLSAQVRTVTQQRDAAAATYEEELANLQDDIRRLNTQVADLTADTRAQLQREIDQRTALQEEYFTAQDDWRDSEMRYILHVAELQERVRRLSGEGAIFEEADGIVASIDHMHNKVTIDIGGRAGVRPGMRFVIFTRDARGHVVQKGVVEVLDTTPDVSMAAIVAVAPDQAIGRGDYVYNLAGPDPRLFVFAGEPQNYTISEWTSFIRANGGEVVGEVQRGDKVADYLIMGRFDEDDPVVVTQVRAARDFGLTILTEERLKEAMGL